MNARARRGIEEVVIFGAGPSGRQALDCMGAHQKAIAFCDNDRSRQGGVFCGLPIVSPESLAARPPARVLIASGRYVEILAQLAALGLARASIDVLDLDVIEGRQIAGALRWRLFGAVRVGSGTIGGVRAGGDIVVMIGPWAWREFHNRAQPLALALARRGYDVKYIDPVEVPIRRSAAMRWVRRMSTRGSGSRLRVALRPADGVEVVEVQSDQVAASPLAAKDFSTGARRVLEPWLEALRREARSMRLILSRHLKRSLFEMTNWDRTVLDIEDPWFDRPKGRHPYTVQAIEHALACADLVTANGLSVASAFREATDKSIHVLANGVDPDFLARLEAAEREFERIARNGSKRRILFAGTIDMRLQFELLTEAMRAFPEVEFCFLGRTSILSWMRRRWDALRTSPNFTHLEAVPYETLPSEMVQADAFILPYGAHGGDRMFPSKLLEYVAAARPVLVSRSYEELEGLGGVLRTYADSASLRAHLDELKRTDFKLDDRARENCRNFVREHTWDRRAAMLDELWRRA
ncbi:hypothetical protein ASA1KI_09420 [Opitutales bacterium ASA1]|uniref:glycosyltransferase family protein n=1 Tax=Congregicoccus parvus TaxID=3081749 RepID=UPI002B2CA3C1|nr:hypothetical protein ASA1KI_09420 [Opitutales bacterium ASA1]